MCRTETMFSLCGHNIRQKVLYFMSSLSHGVGAFCIECRITCLTGGKHLYISHYSCKKHAYRLYSCSRLCYNYRGIIFLYFLELFYGQNLLRQHGGPFERGSRNKSVQSARRYRYAALCADRRRGVSRRCGYHNARAAQTVRRSKNASQNGRSER